MKDYQYFHFIPLLLQAVDFKKPVYREVLRVFAPYLENDAHED